MALFWKDKLRAVFNRSESTLALFENILSQDQRCPGERNVFTKGDFVSDIKKISVLETEINFFFKLHLLSHFKICTKSEK